MFYAVLRSVIFCFFAVLPATSLRVVASLNGLAEGAGPFEVGVMMALVAVVPTFVSIRIGRFIDERGAKVPLAIGLAFMGVSVGLPCVFPVHEHGFWPLYAACSVVGVASVFITLVVQSYVGFVSTPKTKATHFAVFTMGYSAGGLVAPVSSGYVIDNFGFFATYLYLIGFVLIGFVWIALRHKAMPDSWGRKARKGGGSFELLKIPTVRNVLVASTFNSMAWDLQGFMMPVYGTAVGLSATEIGWIIGAFAAATFAIRFCVPYIGRRMAQWHAIGAAFAIGCVAFVLFPAFEDFYALMAVSFLLGIGLGASLPNLLALTDSASPPGRTGEVLGLRTMIINVCHTFLPLAFGAAGAVVGAGAIFYVVGGLMGSMSVFSFRCQKTEAGDEVNV